MADERTAARRLELGIERLIIGSRWLQAPLYVGLIFVLGVVVVKFPFKLWELVQRALIVDEGDLILAVLSLVDLILVANLVIMVIISGYENFVSNIDVEATTDRLAWFGKLEQARSRSSSRPRSWRSRRFTCCSASSMPPPSTTTSSTRWSSCR